MEKIRKTLIMSCVFWTLCNLVFLQGQLPAPLPELRRRSDAQGRYPFTNVTDNSTVLITGVAGFLGYSAALFLLRANISSRLIGVDSFVSHKGSHALKLKYKRADILSHHGGINISRGNVCDPSFLQGLLQSHTFTHIIYLGSDEGHEKEKAEQSTTVVVKGGNQYDERRKEMGLHGDLCFVVLLEALHTLGKTAPRLIFESSPTSFRTKHVASREKLATHYSEQFNFPSIPWRVPLIFGPYGDPTILSLLFDCLIRKKMPTPSCPACTVADCKEDFAYVKDVMSTLPNLMRSKSYSPQENMKHVSLSKSQKDEGHRKQVKRSLEWVLYDAGSIHLCASDCFPDYEPALSCLVSPFDESAQISSTLSQGCETVVYTVAFAAENGRQIRLHEPKHELVVRENQTRSCYFAFLNRPVVSKEAKRGKWVLIQVDSWKEDENILGDSRRSGKFLKFHPGKFFAPSVSQAIYIDAKLQLLADPRDMIRTLRSPEMADRATVLVAVRHPLNEDPFKEAADIRFLKAAYRNDISFTLWTMEDQLQKYYGAMQTHNLSLNNMIDSAILIHDLQRIEGRNFRCAWSREYYRHADRDQLAFPWVLASKGREAGAPNLVPRQEWCPLEGRNRAYVRILPDEHYHWWKRQEWAVDLGLEFVH
jgi:nucleoside-diphosphate-sugar epimerase